MHWFHLKNYIFPIFLKLFLYDFQQKTYKTIASKLEEK